MTNDQRGLVPSAPFCRRRRLLVLGLLLSIAVISLVGGSIVAQLHGSISEYLSDHLNRADWVGHQDVKLEFLVVDAQTERPIEGALLRFFDQEDLDEADLKRQTQTDVDGRAELIEQCVTSGSRSLPRFRQTAVAQLPEWNVRASKQGYTTSTPISIFKQTGGRINLLTQTSPPRFRIELAPDSR